MSKQRPSATYRSPNVLLRRAARPLNYWQARVYRNTYTRAGHRQAVHGWSVKIQLRGIRRAYSLTALTHASAAREARQLYRQLLSEQNVRLARAATETKGGLQPGAAARSRRSGAGRLVLRKYCCQYRDGTFSQYSVRIEHQDQRFYFPLGSLKPAPATARARAIQELAVQGGWPPVIRRFPREVTLALHWTEKPLAWTYTTFHTVPRAKLRSRTISVQAENQPTLALVESDASIREALLGIWNRATPKVRWSGFSDLTAAIGEGTLPAASLLILNQNLASGPTWARWQRLLQSDFVVLLFSVYDDSDELFRAAPGGAGFYVFKRLPPERVLEPALSLIDAGGLSREALALSVGHYFRRQVASPQVDSLSSARLTQREQEILALLAKGYLDKEIAHQLGISSWTVHGHLKKIFEKLKVHTRTEAVVKYLQK